MKTIRAILPLTLLLLGFGPGVLAQEASRIISYNILEGMKTDTTPGKQEFAKWVKEKDPDILALQECNQLTEASLLEIARSYGHSNVVIVKRQGYPTGLTSKYPITNVRRITNNLTHGAIFARVKDLNIAVVHLNPHNYQTRRSEIGIILNEIAAAPSRKNWIVMGDFNSLSPLDKDNYADGKLAEMLRERAVEHPNQKNLVEGKFLDFEVQQKVLDFGLKDAGKIMDTEHRMRGSRIDYIYVSADLMPRVSTAHFIYDPFTQKYSDHRPVLLELKPRNNH